jgi:hypothetical protein
MHAPLISAAKTAMTAPIRFASSTLIVRALHAYAVRRRHPSDVFATMVCDVATGQAVTIAPGSSHGRIARNERRASFFSAT